MTAQLGSKGRAEAARQVLDVLRLALTGKPRRGVLGFASSGRSGLARHVARWRALPPALAQLVRPTPAESPPVVQWVLTREAGGWAVRPAGAQGPPAFFAADIPSDDQNAAMDWAMDVTPDAARKGVRYEGPPPTPDNVIG